MHASATEAAALKQSGTHNERLIKVVHLALWRDVVAECRQEAERRFRAESHDAKVIAHAALMQWSDYQKHRCRKHSSAWIHARIVSVIAMRRRRPLRRWAQTWAAMQQSGRVSHMYTLGAARSFFAWGEIVKERMQRVHHAQVLWQQRRRAAALGRMAKVWQARQFQKASVGRGLIATAKAILHEWRLSADNQALEMQQQADKLTDLQRRNRLGSGFAALHDATSQGRFYKLNVLTLARALERSVKRDQQQLQSLSLDCWLEAVEHDRGVEGEHSELSIGFQRHLALRRWWRRSCQNVNKRTVNVVCDGYRSSQLLRHAFDAWYYGFKRIQGVAKAVYLWAGNLCTVRMQSCLRAWYAYYRQKERCKEAGIRLLISRQRKALFLWDMVTVRKLKAQSALEQNLIAWELSIFESWRQWALLKTEQHRRNDIAIQAVVEARQRRWVDQWCAAWRLNRLSQLAENWDRKVTSHKCVYRAFLNWQEVVLTVFRAGVAASRVGKMHGTFHFRGWKQLAQAIYMRPRRLAMEAFAWWKRAHRVSIDHRDIHWTVVDRCIRIELRSALRWLDRCRIERRRQYDILVAMNKKDTQRLRPLAVSWWKKWASASVRRKASQSR